MKFLIFIVMFLLIGAFFIISEKNLHLNNKENLNSFFNAYGKWIDGLIGNSKVVSGYVVKMDWLPGEGK